MFLNEVEAGVDVVVGLSKGPFGFFIGVSHGGEGLVGLRVNPTSIHTFS